MSHLVEQSLKLAVDSEQQNLEDAQKSTLFFKNFLTDQLLILGLEELALFYQEMEGVEVLLSNVIKQQCFLEVRTQSVDKAL